MTKWTLALGLIASILLIYILVFERNTSTTKDFEGRKDFVLERFNKERVDRLELHNASGTTELRRDLTEEGALWTLSQPFAAATDYEVIQDYVGDLEALRPLRELRNADENDLERFGLKQAKHELIIGLGEEELRLRLGIEAAHAGSYYAKLVPGAEVWVIDRDAAELFHKDALHFRDRALFDEEIEDWVGWSWTKPNGETLVRVRKHEDGWWIETPKRMRASADRMSDLHWSLRLLKAALFLESKKHDRIDTKHEVFGIKMSQKAYVLRIGPECPQAEGTFIAQRDQDAPVCVARRELEELRKPWTWFAEPTSNKAD